MKQQYSKLQEIIESANKRDMNQDKDLKNKIHKMMSSNLSQVSRIADSHLNNSSSKAIE